MMPLTPTRLPPKRRGAMLARLLGTRRARPQPRTVPALAAANLPRLHGRLEIVRDAHGVPHVYAGDQRDLYAALGWLQAADRFFFMDVIRHLGAGRLCGLIGDVAAPKRDPLLGGKRITNFKPF